MMLFTDDTATAPQKSISQLVANGQLDQFLAG